MTILAATVTPGPTNTPSFTPTPAAGGRRAASSTPQLLAWSLGPTNPFQGDTIVMTYTVWSPGAQGVSLGADIGPDSNPLNRTTDGAHDVTNAPVVAGTNTLTRLFSLNG